MSRASIARRSPWRRNWCVRIVVWFFFQAEDGIRDLTVTGVQTCALPISTTSSGATALAIARARAAEREAGNGEDAIPAGPGPRSDTRNDGRRCRCGDYQRLEKCAADVDRFAGDAARARTGRRAVALCDADAGRSVTFYLAAADNDCRLREVHSLGSRRTGGGPLRVLRSGAARYDCGDWIVPDPPARAVFRDSGMGICPRRRFLGHGHLHGRRAHGGGLCD